MAHLYFYGRRYCRTRWSGCCGAVVPGHMMNTVAGGRVGRTGGRRRVGSEW